MDHRMKENLNMGKKMEKANLCGKEECIKDIGIITE